MEGPPSQTKRQRVSYSVKPPRPPPAPSPALAAAAPAPPPASKKGILPTHTTVAPPYYTRVAPPHTTTVSPPPHTATVAPPHVSVAPPHTRVAPPHSNIAPPHTTVSPPYTTSVAPPNTTVSLPHSSVDPPHSSVAPPHSSVAPPRSTVSPPYTTVAPPYPSLPPPRTLAPPYATTTTTTTTVPHPVSTTTSSSPVAPRHTTTPVTTTTTPATPPHSTTVPPPPHSSSTSTTTTVAPPYTTITTTVGPPHSTTVGAPHSNSTTTRTGVAPPHVTTVGPPPPYTVGQRPLPGTPSESSIINPPSVTVTTTAAITTSTNKEPELPGILEGETDAHDRHFPKNEAQRVRECIRRLCGWTQNSFPGGHPVSLCRANLTEIFRHPYVVCEKTDGTRFLMLAASGCLFLFGRKQEVRMLPDSYLPRRDDLRSAQQLTLVDGELVKDQEADGRQVYRFLIYDAVCIEGDTTLREKNLLHRLTTVAERIIAPLRALEEVRRRTPPHKLSPHVHHHHQQQHQQQYEQQQQGLYEEEGGGERRGEGQEGQEGGYYRHMLGVPSGACREGGRRSGITNMNHANKMTEGGGELLSSSLVPSSKGEEEGEARAGADGEGEGGRERGRRGEGGGGPAAAATIAGDGNRGATIIYHHGSTDEPPEWTCGNGDGEASQQLQIYLKDFFEISDLLHIQRLALRLPHLSDGVIFTPVHLPYPTGTCRLLLKWKPPHLNTADFCVNPLYDERGIPRLFQLYVIDTGMLTFKGHFLSPYGKKYKELLEIASKSRSRLGGMVIECYWNPSAPVYTFIPSLRRPGGGAGAGGAGGGGDREFSRRLIEWEKMNGPKPFYDLENGTWKEGGWVVERFRTDKLTPNSFFIVNKIIQSIDDGITFTSLLREFERYKQHGKRSVRELYALSPPGSTAAANK